MRAHFWLKVDPLTTDASVSQNFTDDWKDSGLKNLTSFLLDSLGMGTILDSFQSTGICPV